MHREDTFVDLIWSSAAPGQGAFLGKDIPPSGKTQGLRRVWSPILRE